MASDTTEILTQLAAGQTGLKDGQTAIISTLRAQSELLRLIAEQLRVLLEKLTPEIGEGPTLQELLAEMVARVGDNRTLLRRIDRRTESMAIDLPDDVVRAMKGASGANGKGANGHDANGSAES